MSDDIKKVYRTEFPRVDRVLFIKAESNETAIVWVTNGSTGEIVRLECFEDYDEAMNYYSEQFNNLKSAEDYATFIAAFKMLGLMYGYEHDFIVYETEFTACKRLLCIYATAGGTACVRVRRTDTYEVVKEVTGVGSEEAMELYEKLYNLYAECENCKMSCCTR